MHCLSTRWYLQRFQQLCQFTASKNYQCLPFVVQYKCFYNVKFTPVIFSGKFKYDCKEMILFMLCSLLHVKAADTICFKQHVNFLLEDPLSQIHISLPTRMCVLRKRRRLCAIVSMQIADWLEAECRPIKNHFKKKTPFITEVLDVFCQWDFRKQGL